MRASAIALGACLGVLWSTEMQHDPGSPSTVSPVDPLSTPELLIDYSNGQVRVTGSTMSDEHEDALRKLVDEQFAGTAATFDLRPSVLPVKNWEPATARLIYLVAASDAAVASLRPETVTMRGVTSQPDTLRSRLLFLREVLAPDVRISTDVLAIRSDASFDELCSRSFESLFLQPVTFHESSAEIRDASLVTLDRITEFARDCPGVTIEVRGHSDASGNETWNRQLSLARAQAVADRIIANGIDPKRLIVSGIGSAEPVADNSTAHGREANRRIEFRLR
jgi:OOP family OmpA-OmpF porin